MTQEQIDKFAETEFSEEKARPEVLQKVSINGIEIPILDLMKSSYKAGLKRSYSEEIKEQFSFSKKPKFECDEHSCSYYLVAHLYSAFPELCIYDGKVLISVTSDEHIDSKDIIGAMRVNIPNEVFDDIERMRDVRKHDVLLHDVVNRIDAVHEYELSTGLVRGKDGEY